MARYFTTLEWDCLQRNCSEDRQVHHRRRPSQSLGLYRPIVGAHRGTAMGDNPVMANGGASVGSVLPKSKEAALLALLDRTGFPMVQENGQRRYGPPPDWKGDPPPKGSEVFIGRLPRDMFEDELIPLLERIGPVYELRLMMDFGGSNRGYAFAMYTNPSDARRAIEELDDLEVRRGGRRLGVCRSIDNCRLFVGGIPRCKTREDVLNEMRRVTEGVVGVILYASVADKTKNRGFAFVEYTDHKAAAMARRKLIPGKVKLWGVQEIAVDWAEPEPQVDEETMGKVTILYVRNLMMSTTEDQLRDAFSVDGNLKVVKVKKLRDFAFVHYQNREDAEIALQRMNKCQLDGATVEVSWAKPANRDTRRSRNNSKSDTENLMFPVPPMVFPPPSLGCDLLTIPTSPSITRLPQPIGVGRAPAASRTAIRGRGRGAAGMRGVRPGTTRSSPVYQRALQPYLVDLRPGMQLTPTPQHILFKPSIHPVEALTDLCHRQSWGEPQFQLHSATAPNSVVSVDGENVPQQLFLYKVAVPGLPAPYNHFTPNKLCPNPEEAKEYAAEFVLGQLGVRLNGAEYTVPTVMLPGVPPMAPSPLYSPYTALLHPAYAQGYFEAAF
ncbi:probable RNA-binding protein 46 isoform X2 [Ornithodoros turicata]|uniref:probable RNA-binding protein 46 isoform X2 n=1 Tax=Ornithodoros turicata TaxID=34597 RepID=UPI00313963EF